MIKLDFVVPNNADWIDWISDCQTATLTLVQSHQNNNPVKIYSDLYRGELTRFHQHPFYGKCAYCETKVDVSSPTYVEHFRPKAGVRDINNVTVQVTINGVQVPHPGYYWLAYHWENLLPTCWQCNTFHNENGVDIGKGNRFPVTGNYAINPGTEATETYNLINSLHEDPQNHLFIDSLGMLHPVTGSLKGTTCISFFGLNTRESLVNGRKKEYNSIINKLRLLYTLSDAQEIAHEVAEISAIAKGRDEYTLAARKAIADFTAKVDDIQNQIR
jgi:hypothetical protein